MSDREDRPADESARPGETGSDEPVVDETISDETAFDDPAYDEVRGLLAEVRVTEPVPDDVAARLDHTLARLQRERAEHEAEVRSVERLPLRHRAGRLLVAAAAIVVVGTGAVGIVRGVGQGDTASDDKAPASTADRDSAGGSQQPESSSATGGVEALKGALAGAPVLTRAHFERDVVTTMRALDRQRATLADTDSSYGQTPDGSPDDVASSEAPSAPAPELTGRTAPPVTATPRAATADAVGGGVGACPGPDVADAVTLPATLDGATVALVFRSPSATAQVVEAWSCDGGTLLASATVPR